MYQPPKKHHKKENYQKHEKSTLIKFKHHPKLSTNHSQIMKHHEKAIRKSSKTNRKSPKSVLFIHEKPWKSIRTYKNIHQNPSKKHPKTSTSPIRNPHNGADHGLSPATDPEPAELPKPLRSPEPAEPAERERRAQVRCNVGPLEV